MRNPSCRRLLLIAVGSFAVLAPAGVAAAACPSRPPPPCRPVAFTGSAGAHLSRCVQPPARVCVDRRGPRGAPGLQGVTGQTGAAGSTGAQGLQGVRGDAGAAGSRGATGSTGAVGATGSGGGAGAIGATGSQGVIGAIGADGVAGQRGLQGVQGEIGAPGAPGDAGSQGTAGATGATGIAGPPGTAGADGPPGATGAAGVTGAAGATGATGPAGSSAPARYAYVYNVLAKTIAVEADVTFDSNGPLSAGITHAPGTAEIAFTSPGAYKVTFSVSGTEPSQMALFLNGALVGGTLYGSGAGTQQNTGQAIVTIAAGDLLTVRNHTSSAAVGLASNIGGTQANVNASVLIEQLS
jgi:hypothetical protein